MKPRHMPLSFALTEEEFEKLKETLKEAEDREVLNEYTIKINQAWTWVKSLSDQEYEALSHSWRKNTDRMDQINYIFRAGPPPPPPDRRSLL